MIAGHLPFTGILLGEGAHSLSAILRGDTHRDEWRFINSLDQSSPWSTYPDSERPGMHQEVTCHGGSSLGMLWAKLNSSTVFSFAFQRIWDDGELRAEYSEVDASGEISSIAVRIPNLARPEHVTAHAELIASYGRDLSASSLIHEGDGFVIRIYFNDHDPPHFHVFLRRDSIDTLARIRIGTLDVLSGDLAPALRNRVRDWARGQGHNLMMNWDRCRDHRRPFVLD